MSRFVAHPNLLKFDGKITNNLPLLIQFTVKVIILKLKIIIKCAVEHEKP
jgi:hypothetical protein